MTGNTIHLPLISYGIAILAVWITFAFRFLLDPILGDHAPLLAFILPVAVSAFYGGLGPGLFATALSFFIASYFFVQPMGSFLPTHSIELVREGIFVVIGVFISILSNERLKQIRIAREGQNALEESRQQLIESKEQVVNILESITDAFYVLDREWNFTYINPEAERILLRSKKELLGKNIWNEFPSATEYSFHVMYQRVMNEKLPIEFIEFYPDPLNAWYLLKAYPSKNGISVYFRDVTAQRQAEEALKKSEAEFRAVFDNSLDAILIADDNGKYIDANPAACDLLNLTKEEITKRSVEDFTIPRFQQNVKKAWGLFLESGEQRGELELQCHNGKTVEVEFSATANILPGQHLSVLRDITKRKEAERLLRETETKYRTLVEASPAIVYLSEAYPPYSTKYITPNIDSLGYPIEKWYEKPDFWFNTVLYKEDRKRVLLETESAISQGRETDLNFRVVAKDGSIRWWHDKGRFVTDEQGNNIGWQGVIVDITETKRLEEQLRQSQKLESVGRLAGGIAHDFNNMLTAINGYSDMTLRKLDADNPLRGNIEEIKKAGERSASLTQQLLAFSRQQILQPKILDLNETIQDTSKMLQRLIGEDIELQLVLNPKISRIEVDPGQLTQVIINLIVNARDAMPNGGSITIQTDNVHLDEEFVQSHLPMKTGNYVMLSVSDNGSGMNEEIRNQIFDPFFTTKGPGEGTGLGLATVYGILKQSDGYIWAESEIGQGTTFLIYFPPVMEEIKTEEANSVDYTFHSGIETILVVEDELIVRNLTRLILEECGYQVIEAGSGKEALEICEQGDYKIDLLMTDVVMPGMSGRELAEKLTTLLPGLKILFTSGYNNDAIIKHEISETGQNFIQKPFTFEALSKKLREVLDDVPL